MINDTRYFDCHVVAFCKEVGAKGTGVRVGKRFRAVLRR